MVWEVFNTVALNSGFTFENIVLIIVVCGGLIFAARNFMIALLLYFLIFTATFIWFYAEGYNWGIPLILVMMSLVGLAFLLYFSSSQAKQVQIT